MGTPRTETDRRGIAHPQFTDNQGRKWTIALDFEVYRRVLTEHDVDLCDIVYQDQKCLRQLDQPMILVDVLFEIVRVQAVERGVDEFDFARALDMAIVCEAQRKLVDEMIFFSRSHPRADIVREAVAAAERAEKALREEVTKALPKVRKAMEKVGPFAHGDSGGGSPESSASIPEGGRSDNSRGPQASDSVNRGTTPPPSSRSKPKRTAIQSDVFRRSLRKTSTRSSK